MVTTGSDVDILTEDFRNLTPETPPDASPIPRYLFRVFSSHSAGRTSEKDVQSKATCSPIPEIKRRLNICIFRKERKLASDIVLKHLMWSRGNDEDNLVSWTSSILFAIVYIFYHHAQYKAPFEEIRLLILDATRFAKKTFICDNDLIKAFEDDGEDWARLKNWRAGKLYFGEYLSRGQLEIQGNCKMVSAEDLLEFPGLLQAHDKLQDVVDRLRQDGHTSLARPVLECREVFSEPRVRMQKNRLVAIVRVADLFGIRWRLPVALNLASMQPYLNTARGLSAAFTMESVNGELSRAELISCHTQNKVVVKHDQLHEVNELYRTTQSIYHIDARGQMLGCLLEANGVVDNLVRNQGGDRDEWRKIQENIRELIDIQHQTQ